MTEVRLRQSRMAKNSGEVPGPCRAIAPWGTADGANGAKFGLGFTEEMALELRSSTEELDFQDPEENETKTRRKKLQHQQQAVTKYELEAQSEKETHERKDSACSEGGLLLIGGRTSRLSSIGSVASGGSAASHVSGGSAISGNSHLSAGSHVSAQSRLSAISNYSRASRCSSPHRMLLETSFCGPKPIPTVSLEAEYPPKESVEAALLARKSDPTGAVLPSETPVNRNVYSTRTTLDVNPVKVNALDPKSKPRSHSERLSKTSGPAVSYQPRSNSARVHLKNTKHSDRKKNDDNELVRIIPLHGSLEEPEDANLPQETEEPAPSDDNAPYVPEYGIYIPLKGPIVDYSKKDVTTESKAKSKKPQIEESDLVRFISLHGDDDENIQKPKTEITLKSNHKNGQNVQFKPWSEEPAHFSSFREKHSKKPRTPDPINKCKPATLELATKNGRPAQSMTHLPRDESRTPSPATSFTKGALFRRSSDSSSSSKKSANTSGSADSKTKKDSRNKSMFSSLFKKNVKEPPTQRAPAEEKASLDPKFTNVEFKFKQEEADSIIIPLHSPDSIVEPCILYDPDVIEPVNSSEVSKNLASCKESKDIQPEVSVRIQQDEAQVMERNVIVVDVINEDTKEITEIASSSDHPRDSHENSSSSAVCTIELETLEYEPKVRRSSSVSKNVIETMDICREIVGEKKNEKHEEINIKEEVVVANQNDSVKGSVKSLENVSAENHELNEVEDQRGSSASEIEAEIDQISGVKSEECDEERKGLFNQGDSIEDELPYVPTTLPQERSVAVPIIPIRQRMTEVKTIPVDRPRSTTPIQPSNLEEYAATHDGTKAMHNEKMQITLPRTDSIGKSKSPGKTKPWTQFAEECLLSPKEQRKCRDPSPHVSTPPPLPPRGTAPIPTTQWVLFDEQQPERRRAPRRITTLPLRHTQQQSTSNIVYSYVNPEECSCECHESQGKVNNNSAQCSNETELCLNSKKGSRTEKEKRYRT
uniref:Uncharacterized protein n=1 Tax=Rhodnius prolixus TaxID=13249 RepID=T1HC41_RHOPR